MIIDRLHPILQRFRAPAGDDGEAGGSGTEVEDRGDDFTPTGDDAPDATKDKGAKKDDDGEEDDAAKAKEGEKKDDGKAKEPEKKDDEKKDDEKKDDEKKDDEKKRKDDRLPLSRHKEILEKERARADDLERQLKAYQGGDRVAATNAQIKQAEDKIADLDAKYTKFVTDGEHEKAAALRREMRTLENEVIELKSDMKAAAASAQAVEKMRYDITVERLEAAYPVLDPEHDSHDPDKTQDVLDLAASYRTRRGMTPAEAIQKAAKTLLGAESKKQEDATSVKARVDEEEAKAAAKKAADKEAADKAAEKEAERKKSQVEKNLDTDKRQPADTAKRGSDSDKAGGGINAKDVLKMSQEDFNKLDDETLARMRGDII